MFKKPKTQENGMHVIILDNRFERDNVYSDRQISGCKGKKTKILSEKQWLWLENELERESEIKIIGNGIQVRMETKLNHFNTPEKLRGITTSTLALKATLKNLSALLSYSISV